MTSGIRPPQPATTPWEVVADQVDRLPSGWRRHARDAHLQLLGRWIGVPHGCWLKTDTAEELQPERALLPHLADASWVGVDIALGALAGARCSRAQADVRRLPFTSGAFDGVLSTSTLDHFDDGSDIEVALREVHRVLKPGGLLVLTLDNAAHPLIRLRNALPPAVRDRTGLVPYPVGPTLDAQSGRALLRTCGFEVRDVAHVLHAPHIVGTRLAVYRSVERRVLPWLDERLGASRLASRTGHFVAFLAQVPPG